MCGCDGITYPNPRLAASQGVSIAAFGPCEGGTHDGCGTAGSHCAEGEFCERQGCNGTEGHCETKPQACDAVFAPGSAATASPYSNPCAAASQVSVAHLGDCM